VQSFRVIRAFRLRKETGLASRTIVLEELQHELRDRAVGGRIIVALAGPPGSGKSTLAELLAEASIRMLPAAQSSCRWMDFTTTIFT
jgi:pantothenate kinase